MLDHHIQRAIVYKLAFASSLRFGELKPDDIENKLFTYHLKKVVNAGYIEKNKEGEYQLTAEGRRIGKGAFDSDARLLDRAYSTLLLAIRRKSDGAWLLYKRHTHPMIDLAGFMHAQPIAEATAPATAAKECQLKTSLIGEFSVHGHGYFRVYRDKQLESFTHFTLLVCDDIQGELTQNSKLADYYWEQQPDFSGDHMLPNMQLLYEMTQTSAGSFIEQTFHL
jgi:DNA-binding transcriptional ArsR family regulator